MALTEQIGFHLSHAITNLSAYDQIRQLKDQLEQENVYLREEMGASLDLKSLVGDSPSVTKSLRAIEMVAPQTLPCSSPEKQEPAKNWWLRPFIDFRHVSRKP